MSTLTAPELMAQALVLYIGGGREASAVMEEMQGVDNGEITPEGQDIPRYDNGNNFAEDDSAMPEGMALRETSMGVIPHA